jgi:hypothetical protein
VSARETRVPSGGHVSRLSLIQLRGNALDAAARAEAEAHLASCDRCAALYGVLQREAAAFEKEFPTWNALRDRNPAASATPPRPLRVEPGPAWWSRFLEALRPSPGPRAAFAGLLVLAAIGSVLWLRGPGPAVAPSGGDTFTAKGAPTASFYLFVNGGQAGSDSLICGPGDTLQLGLTGPEPVHYSVLYQDDQEPVRPYLSNADGGRPLGSPAGDNLPHSLVLKGTWKRELLHCLWSPKPFTTEEAASRVRDAANPSRPDIRLRTFTLTAPR